MDHFNPHLSISNDLLDNLTHPFKRGIIRYVSISDIKSPLETRFTPTNISTSLAISYQVNGVNVINNRGIHNDEVIYNTDNREIVAITRRSKQVIVGILHLNSNKKYGFTKRKVPYYKFTPITKKFPSFIVPSKDLRRVAMICVISFNKWDITSKNPIGQIEKLVGVVGDFGAETEMLLYKNSIYPKKNKIKYNVEKNSIATNTIDIYNTVSIDPPGCKDIDDALSFKLIANNKVEVSIHIANVAQWVDRHNLITNLYSTIYLKNGEQINMLDDDITYNKLSLGSNGIPKNAMSLFLVYDMVSTNTNTNKYTLVDSYFREVSVKNTAISYRKSDAILAKANLDIHSTCIYEPNSIEWMIVNLANLCGGDETHEDSKVLSIPSTKMVEHFMLLYNKIVAEKLYNYNKNTILRTHRLAETSSISTHEDKLTKYLLNLNQNAAKYISNPINTYHESIGSQYYTHATSPIRRFIDVINQLNLQSMLCSHLEPPLVFIVPDYLDILNEFNKNLRKFYNNYKKLNIVHTFNNTSSPTDDGLLSEKSQTLDAYIVEITPYKLKLYIPLLDIEHSCQPISPKLQQSNHISVLAEEATPPNKMTINDTVLSLHDKIKIKMTVLPYEEQFNKKLYITIVDPHINLL
jgi:exoribonuclease R